MKTMTKKAGVMSALAFVLAVLFGVGISTPAYASDLVIKYVGSSTAVTAVTTYDEYGKTYALSIVAYWSNHTTNSVRLDSVKLCSGKIPLDQIQVHIYLTRHGALDIDYYGYKSIPSTGCHTWTVGRTYSKLSDGELVRVIANVNAQLAHIQTGAFFR